MLILEVLHHKDKSRYENELWYLVGWAAVAFDGHSEDPSCIIWIPFLKIINYSLNRLGLRENMWNCATCCMQWKQVQRDDVRWSRVPALPEFYDAPGSRLLSMPGRALWSRTAWTPSPPAGRPGLCGTCWGWARRCSHSGRGGKIHTSEDYDGMFQYIRNRQRFTGYIYTNQAIRNFWIL